MEQEYTTNERNSGSPTGPLRNIAVASPAVDAGMSGRIAAALAAAYPNTAWDRLVSVLGGAPDTDGNTALEQWVARQLLSPDETNVVQLLPVLIRRLNEILDQGDN